MIIGERQIENSCRDNSSNEYEVLKEKLSDDKSDYSDQFKIKKINLISKMQYMESHHTFQSLQEQIHQDGDQSYINLTVLTPSMIQYEKSDHQELQQACFNQINTHQNNNQHREGLSPEAIKQKNMKFESRNYLQKFHQSGRIFFINVARKVYL
jgi:hypothetical protein